MIPARPHWPPSHRRRPGRCPDTPVRDAPPHAHRCPPRSVGEPARCSARTPRVMSRPASTARRTSSSCGHGMAEHRKQPIAFGRGDVAPIVVDGPLHLLAVSAHQQADRARALGCVESAVESTRSANKIVSRRISPRSPGEAASKSSASVLPSSTASTLSRQSTSSGPIAAVDGPHRPVKQLVNRRTSLSARVATLPRAHLTVAHLKHRATTESRDVSETHWSKTLRIMSSATRLDDIPGKARSPTGGTGLV